MLQEGESAEHHLWAADILLQPLKHLGGAYSAALLHVRRALELDSKNIPALLMLNIIETYE